GNKLYKEIYKKSAEIRTRVNTAQKQYLQNRKALNEKLNKGQKALLKIQEAGMWGQGKVDMMMTTIGWTAVYNETFRKTGNEEQAIIKADKATRESQPNANAFAQSAEVTARQTADLRKSCGQRRDAWYNVQQRTQQ
ncbi:MAG: hypothetical protein LBB22_04530, partial [Treponema sp.]|nr:hypothetical protein [Treponema sp.]